MSFTLLEKQGSIQYPKSGALINYHALGKQSGRLFGCDVVLANSETIVLTTGVLVIKGYRIEVVNHIVFNVLGLVVPAKTVRQNIILRVDAGFEDTEIELLVTDEAPIYSANIEKTSGIYDYLIGTFNFSPGGISELRSYINTINNIFTKVEGLGTVWFNGTDVVGTNDPIVSVKGLETIPNLKVGDFYLNSETCNYYRCDSITDEFAIWKLEGSLLGESGPQGPQGETGAQGPQGIQGETGPSAVISTSILDDATSDTKAVSPKAVKTYVDGKSTILATSGSGGNSTISFWVGTQAQYQSIITKEPNTIYFIKE